MCWLEHCRSCDGRLQIQSISALWHLHTQPAKHVKSYGEVLLDLRQVHQCQETSSFSFFYFSETVLKISPSAIGRILQRPSKNFIEFRIHLFILTKLYSSFTELLLRGCKRCALGITIRVASIIIGLSTCNELTILMIWLIMTLRHQRVL